jgi:hypothetical protein
VAPTALECYVCINHVCGVELCSSPILRSMLKISWIYPLCEFLCAGRRGKEEAICMHLCTWIYCLVSNFLLKSARCSQWLWSKRCSLQHVGTKGMISSFLWSSLTPASPASEWMHNYMWRERLSSTLFTHLRSHVCACVHQPWCTESASFFLSYHLWVESLVSTAWMIQSPWCFIGPQKWPFPSPLSGLTGVA